MASIKYQENGEIKDLTLKIGDTLPTGTEVDYNGDTVPTGWEEIGDTVQATIGTTNPNNDRVWFKQSKNLFIPTTTNNGTVINIHDGNVSVSNNEFTFNATGTDLYFGEVRNANQSYSNNCGTLYNVTPGETIKVLYTNNQFNVILITKYTSEKVSLGYSVFLSNEATLEIPENCYYITIRIGKNNAVSGTTYKTKVMLAKGTGDITYEDYITPSIIVDDTEFYSKPDEEWEILTLSSEFKNYNNTATFQPRIKKEGSVVTIEGIISPINNITNMGSEHIICTIPEKYRPKVMPLHQVCQASGINKWLLIVAIGGNVTLSRYGTTEYIDAPANSWLPFTITYLV